MSTPKCSKVFAPYGTNVINHVVVTHPDRDHAEGLAPILEEFDVQALWMLCPWHYAADIIQFFPSYESVEALQRRLQGEYPYIHDLEKIAIRRKIPMGQPFQGMQIGAFRVLAPCPAQYLQLIIQSEKTPKQASVGIRSANALRKYSIASTGPCETNGWPSYAYGQRRTKIVSRVDE